MSYTDRL